MKAVHWVKNYIKVERICRKGRFWTWSESVKEWWMMRAGMMRMGWQFDIDKWMRRCHCCVFIGTHTETDRQTDRWLLQWYCMQARRHDATATRLRASRPVICVSRRHSASASRDWRQMALLYARHTAAPSRYRKWSTAHARDSCRLVPVSPARCRCCCVVTRTCATTAATSVMLYLHLVSVYKKNNWSFAREQ